MPSLRDIKRRIDSVKSTQQITKAMKMVAAAKLQKAQVRLNRIRPYSNAYLEMLQENAFYIYETIHPIFKKIEKPKNILLLVISSDRGLCGGFNSNIFKKTISFLNENKDKNIKIISIGNKGIYFFRKKYPDLLYKEFRDVMDKITYNKANSIIKIVYKDFLTGKCDTVKVIYNEFKSAMSQKVTVEKLLPLEVEPKRAELVVYDYEPSFEYVISDIALEYLYVNMYRILLESSAGEFGARMAAMSSATDNASEMISELTLQYNRIRQATITKEISEIVGGAEALKNK